MIVRFDKSFLKSIKKLKDSSVKNKIEVLIQQLEKSTSLSKVPNCRKLSGYKTYHRIRLGDYRIGLEETEKGEVVLVIVAHRKDIYNKFP